uniref:LptA/OstA family protein n=1 Tax=Vulcanococcus sp. DEBay_Sum29NL08_54 TaxID=2806303 RepID=UPI0025ED0AC8
MLTQASADQSPPVVIKLLANEQGFDQRINRFVARGDVQIDLAGGRVLADRLEYETATRTLLLSGRVRFQRGEQYFQANSLRYSLIENSGDADAVYGVLDFDTSEVDFDLKAYPSVALPSLSYWPTWSAYEKATFSTNPPRLLRKDLKGQVLVDVSWANQANTAELALAADPLRTQTDPVALKG